MRKGKTIASLTRYPQCSPTRWKRGRTNGPFRTEAAGGRRRANPHEQIGDHGNPEGKRHRHIRDQRMKVRTKIAKAQTEGYAEFTNTILRLFVTFLVIMAQLTSYQIGSAYEMK